MAKVTFTDRLHAVGPTATVAYDGETLLAVLNAVAGDFPRLKPYVLDEHERLRKHVAIFIDGALARGPSVLATPLTSASDVYVMQALSGG